MTATRDLQPDDAAAESVDYQPYYAHSWALVIGIDDYRGQHPTLTNARSDAEAMAALLQGQYGFDEVHTLYDEEATLRQIMFWLRDAARQ